MNKQESDFIPNPTELTYTGTFNDDGTTMTDAKVHYMEIALRPVTNESKLTLTDKSENSVKVCIYI